MSIGRVGLENKKGERPVVCRSPWIEANNDCRLDGRLRTGCYEPRLLRSSLACCSAFLVAPLASASGFMA